MLKSKAKWMMNETNDENDRSIIDILLEERGITSEEEKHQFLHPELNTLEHPKHFAHIDKAKDRIYTAIEKDEKIIVYGDYDADGVTSTALLTNVLTELGANVQFYIPNRFEEGYGLHAEAIKQFYEDGIKVIITVDNGISNVTEAEVAKQLGIDLIITDHHEVQDEIPEAFAIIHPKLSPNYEFKHLAGVGVAFQFAHYLLESLPTQYLDLVAIGTIADLVPLIGENRIFAHFGLKQLAKTEHIGIKVLMERCGLTEEVNERDIGFIIGPRLNAVGRLQDADLAVQLLLTDDVVEAEQIAEQIELLNAERQKIVSDIVKEAEKRIDKEKNIIILYDKDWHEGVLGIAASRLVNKYHRPVMMLHLNEETNELKGSGRSIPAFHLFDNCMKIRHLFLKFGGHSQAAGMTFTLDNLEEIESTLHAFMEEQLTEEDYKRQIKVSKSISVKDMTEELIHQISMLAPFGIENEEPIFHVKATPTTVRQIGQEKNHLKIQFKENNHAVEALGFGYGHYYYVLSEHTPVSIVGKLQINEWNGIRTVQMMIEDLAMDEWLLFDYRGKQDFLMVQNFKPFYEHHTLVMNQPKAMNFFVDMDEVQVVTYDADLSTLDKTDVLYICDLPNSFTPLENIIEMTQPNCIHVSYNITENAYLKSIPSRDEFKWLYGFLFKYNPIHLKVDLPKIIDMKRWTKDKVIFMIKVFLDLNFISVQDDVITVVKNAEKRALESSVTYQKRVEQSNIEKVLYYSTYTELKDWFQQKLNKDNVRKEVLNGL